jgi:hypothetical protein
VAVNYIDLRGQQRRLAIAERNLAAQRETRRRSPNGACRRAWRIRWPSGRRAPASSRRPPSCPRCARPWPSRAMRWPCSPVARPRRWMALAASAAVPAAGRPGAGLSRRYPAPAPRCAPAEHRVRAAWRAWQAERAAQPAPWWHAGPARADPGGAHGRRRRGGIAAGQRVVAGVRRRRAARQVRAAGRWSKAARL